MFEAEAKERQGARTDIRANLPEGSAGRARDKAAAAVNVSERTPGLPVTRRIASDGPGVKVRLSNRLDFSGNASNVRLRSRGPSSKRSEEHTSELQSRENLV